VTTTDEQLSQSTDYSYTISSASDTSLNISATTIYGAMYALETIAQLSLADPSTQLLPLEIEDSPSYGHRGFMVDTGRRFVPVPLMLQQLDSMAAFKMNVLHLHFADWCRYAIESPSFPELTDALTGEQVRWRPDPSPNPSCAPPPRRISSSREPIPITRSTPESIPRAAPPSPPPVTLPHALFTLHSQAGHYTAADIAEIIAYANDRGIRVIPEIDLPGHSMWGMPLQNAGLEYCTGSFPPSLLDDANNATLSTLTTLVTEIAGTCRANSLCDGSRQTGGFVGGRPLRRGGAKSCRRSCLGARAI
jgi:hypothetical protein